MSRSSQPTPRSPATRSITASPQDLREYWDKIPVTLVDGVQIDFWRVSETRLRAALGERP